MCKEKIITARGLETREDHLKTPIINIYEGNFIKIESRVLKETFSFFFNGSHMAQQNSVLLL